MSYITEVWIKTKFSEKENILSQAYLGYIKMLFMGTGSSSYFTLAFNCLKIIPYLSYHKEYCVIIL